MLLLVQGPCELATQSGCIYLGGQRRRGQQHPLEATHRIGDSTPWPKVANADDANDPTAALQASLQWEFPTALVEAARQREHYAASGDAP